MLERKSYFRHAFWDVLTGGGAFYDRLSGEGALWNRSTFREKKTRDNYTLFDEGGDL